MNADQALLEEQELAPVAPAEAEPQGEAVAGESPAPQDGEASPQEKAPEDPEVTVSVGGRDFTLKQSEALELLERRASLYEKEKSLNRGWTQKTQALAAERKAYEEAFGRHPEAQELKALGQIYRKYFADEKVRNLIDAILAEKLDETMPQDEGGSDPLAKRLMALERKLEQKFGSLEQAVASREEHERLLEAQRHWNGWVAEKKAGKTEITPEIENQMVPFITAFREAHPDWEPRRILDEAFRHATIGQAEANATKKVLINLEDAKKKTPPRITAQPAKKAESEKTFGEILQEDVNLRSR